MDFKKISFIFPERTPYNDLLLNEITKLDTVEATIYYLPRKIKRHAWVFIEHIDNTFICNTYLQIYKLLTRNLLKNRPDFVIINGYAPPKFLLVLSLLKLLRIRFAFWSDTPILNRKRSLIKNKIRLDILNWIFKNAEFILVTGQVGIDAYKYMGCPANKLKNLPFAVDLAKPLKLDEKFKNYVNEVKYLYSNGNKIILLCAGQLIPSKRFDVAIKALKICLTRGHDKRLVLLIAGEGSQKNELVGLVSNLGLEKQVNFLGWCQPNLMHILFYISDILIHPAEWDPYPNTVLEAMAWGKPVLASDQSLSAVDRVQQGESGFIHPTGDIDELSNHILYFLKDPSLIATMGASARKTAEHWPVSRCVQTILDLV